MEATIHPKIERRSSIGQMSAVVGTRATAPAAKRFELSGYAATFNSETVIAGMFRERILEGAFRQAIARDDVSCLFNHREDNILGRTGNGTVRLVEDRTGLHYSCTLNPDDPDAHSVHAKALRGDLRGSSFAFTIDNEDEDEQWDFPPGQLPLRTIKRARLWDVSPVTSPAYSTTSVSASARNRAAGHRSEQQQVVEDVTLDHELRLLELDLMELDALGDTGGASVLDNELLLLDLELLALDSGLSTAPPRKRAQITGIAVRWFDVAQHEAGHRGYEHAYSECFVPGSFRELLAGKPDVRCLLNHDWTREVASTRDGSLLLFETPHGLAFRITPKDSGDGQVAELCATAGSIRGVSMAWVPEKCDFIWHTRGYREITRAGSLQEITLVIGDHTPMRSGGWAGLASPENVARLRAGQ